MFKPIGTSLLYKRASKPWARALLSTKPDTQVQSSIGKPKPKPMIHHILARLGESSLPTIKDTCTLGEAIAHVHKRPAAALVVNKENTVVGLYTAKDMLRFIDRCNLTSDTADTLQNFSIEKVMKETSRWVHCSPSDSVHTVREIMFQLKIRSIPVIEKGLLLGVLGLKHLSDSTFTAADSGKKSELLENLAGRRGFAKGVTIKPCKNIQAVLAHEYKHHISTYEPHSESAGGGREDETSYEKSLSDLVKTRPDSVSFDDIYPALQASVGSYGLPHPFKKHPEDGQRKGIVAPSRRHHGPGHLATDMSLCEDAFFVHSYPPPANAQHSQTDFESDSCNTGTCINAPVAGEPLQELLFMCVADGVGGWREYGVDPRQYAFALTENARQVVDEFCSTSLAGGRDRQKEAVASLLHPIDVLTKAWERTNSAGASGAKVSGSSTICVATIDLLVNQLYYSNIGDSGLIVLRHISAEIAGYMRSRQDREDQAAGRDPLRIAYISQQQLKSFNFPYQVGFSDLPDYSPKFETPVDADTGRF
jgi:protein phosphatase PTC7